MITDKQKEALKAVLELHRGNKMTDEQVLTVIEALTENTQIIQYAPWSVEIPAPVFPGTNPRWTYQTTCQQEVK